MRRGISAVAMAAAIVLGVTACGGSGSSDGKSDKAAAKDPAAVSGTITYWDTSDAKNEAPAYQALIKDFEAKYPKIKVTYQNVDFTTVEQKFKAAAQSGKGAPDVVSTDVGLIPEYASLHYIAPLDGTAALSDTRPTHYRVARTWLMISTLIGLVGFTLLPTAPPRLVGGGHGFIDTMAQYGSYGWWGTDASAPRGLGHLTNQYAAMPSLHFGWSLWCGVVIAVLAPRWWMKALGLLHPFFTVSAILATANHWVLDAVGGAVVVTAGFGLSYLVQGPRVRTVLSAARAGEQKPGAVAVAEG
jgi:hypothetical protein